MFVAYAYANHLRSFFNKDHTLQGPKQRCSNLFELLKGNYIIIFVEKLHARIIREFDLMEEIL